MPLAPGDTVGPYRIIEQIGEGGMATVYKAFQAGLGRMVALKVLPEFFASKKDFQVRFKLEATSVAQLRHPNIPVVFDYGQQGAVSYIASELIPGGTLADHIGNGPIPVAEALRWLAPIGSALDYAHGKGVLHRDIKPSNVLLGEDGTPYLSDFGLARIMGTEAERLTATGMVLGTPEYMSPEQCVGEEVTPASDVYSLSVIAYEMLTGRVPFKAATPVAVIMAQVHDPLPLPRRLNPDLPAAAEEALLQGLAKEPAHRYQSASQLVDALASGRTVALPVKSPQPSTAVPPSIPAQPRWGRVRLGTTPPILIAAATVLIVAIVAGTVWLHGRAASPPALAGLPPHGALIYRAALDGTARDLQNVQAAGGAIAYQPGAIELRVLKAGNGPSANLKMAPVTDYVGSLDLVVGSGSAIEFNWGVRQPTSSQQANVILDLRAPDGTMALLSVPYQGDPRALTQTIDVPALRLGKPLSLAVAVTGTHYTVYLDGKQVATATDGSATGPTDPQIAAYGSHGTVRITGVGVYQPA